LLPAKVFGLPGQLERAAQHPAVGTHACECRILRRQPDLRVVRELNWLERMSPGGVGLPVQIQVLGRSERTLSHDTELGTNPWLRVVCERDLAPHNVQNRGFAPAKTVTEVQRKRPVAGEFRTRLGLDGGAGFGLTMDPGGAANSAPPFERAIDRHRTVDAVAPPVERDTTRALDITIDVAICVDPPEKHPAMH